jgi:parafibromin
VLVVDGGIRCNNHSLFQQFKLNNMTSFVRALRAAISAKQDIKLDKQTDSEKVDINDASSVVLNNTDEFSLPDKSGFQSTTENFEYDVKTVYFCWLNKDATVTDYISACEENKIKVISFMERTDLTSYLQGDIDTSSYLVSSNESSSIISSSTTTTGSTAETERKQIKSSTHAETKSSLDIKSSTSNKSTSSDKSQSKLKKRTEEVEKIDYIESKKRKLEQDPLLKCISIHEIELIDHDKALRGTQKSNDFSNLIRECEYKIVRPLKLSSLSSSGSSGSASKSKPSSSATISKSKVSTTGSSSNSKYKSSSSSTSSSLNNNINDSTSLATILRKKDPIIILSPSAISMLTMNNVKSFLQDGKFIDPQSTNSTENSTVNSNMVQIIRQSKRFNKKIKFVIVSNVEKFFVKPEYWDRVVAVFTTGQEWQFKNYKINQPNLLFQKVKGFYVNYNGDIIPNNVKNWNVQIISLDRNQRFKDRQISEFLWESIERFMFSKGYK